MRDLSRTALKAGASLAGAATTGYGILFSEAVLARIRIGITDDRPPAADGVYGHDLAGNPASCLILGDSAAVGYGMTRADDTPLAMIGIGLSHVLGRPVRITNHAVVGARSSDLAAQIAHDLNPDIAVIVIGTNDVTHQIPPSVAARSLRRSVHTLISDNCQVVVGTTPDLGTIQPIKQPLRAWAHVHSRKLAEKQAEAVVQEGGIAVSLGGLLGPVFAQQSDVMFGADRFHPSAEGYANMVSVMMPSIVSALRRSAVDAYSEWMDTPRDTSTVGEAAAHASRHAGTELTRTGRSASIRRRFRRNRGGSDD